MAAAAMLNVTDSVGRHTTMPWTHLLVLSTSPLAEATATLNIYEVTEWDFTMIKIIIIVN